MPGSRSTSGGSEASEGAASARKSTKREHPESECHGAEFRIYFRSILFYLCVYVLLHLQMQYYLEFALSHPIKRVLMDILPMRSMKMNLLTPPLALCKIRNPPLPS